MFKHVTQEKAPKLRVPPAGKSRGAFILRELAAPPGKGRVAHDRVFGLGTSARKIASGGKWGYIGSQPRGKTEIPVHGIKPPIQSSSICGDKNQLP